MCNLQVQPNTLVFFIDETGHELLNDPVQRVFGFGGCSILGRHLDNEVRRPWAEVRSAIEGAPDAPLHATGIGESQIDPVIHFFGAQRVGRFGAVCSVATENDDDLAPMEFMAGALKNRIVQISKWQPFGTVALIFEHSQRLQAQVEAAFCDFGLNLEDKPIPLELCWMDKAANEPGLEVADFIANAIGRQVRHKLDGIAGYNNRFAACFHGVDGRLASFIDIGCVAPN